MTLKLYYWDAVIAVGNYGPGEVVIMANSKKEALETIRKKLSKDEDADDFETDLYNELETTKPKVYMKPTAIWIGGSA